VDRKCLARYTDDIWYPAVVIEEPSDPSNDPAATADYQVMFDDYEETLTVGADQIIPYGNCCFVFGHRGLFH
jgi:hypothetical protein